MPARSLRSRLPAPVKALLRPVRDRIRRALLRAAYVGRGAECPCCGGRFRTFRAFHGRPDVYCPGCDSLERHRLLTLYLRNKSYLAENRPLTLLHFAPEEALERSLRAFSGIRHVTVDLESPRAELKMDITDLDLASDSADVIICSHVLEHVDDDRRAMAELYRVLKPGGRALVMCPVDEHRAETFEDPSVTDPAERERLFWQSDHVRIYGADLADRLAEAGFGVQVVDYVEQLPPDVVSRCRLRSGHRWGPDEIYDLTKRATV
jgi:SAM-dependent methyltransferase